MSKYLYWKCLGLIDVIVGFAYSITTFNNFFEFIFKTRIFNENLNIFLLSIGLIFPLTWFILGIYFYLYFDFNLDKNNKFIYFFNILFLLFSLIILVFKILFVLKNVFLLQIFEFIHISFAYCLLLLSSLGIYGCIKYK